MSTLGLANEPDRNEASINSAGYWNARFAGDWTAQGGRQQTCFFADVALRSLPAWIARDITLNRLTIVDWGCAEGDATDILARSLGTSVTGVDIAERAIASAQSRFPERRFLCRGIDEIEAADVLFTSNTLEHFSDPLDVLSRLLSRIRKYALVLVPFREGKRHEEHLVTFDLNSFPYRVGKFYLLFFAVTDTTGLPDSMWTGQQILVVYANEDAVPPEQQRLSVLAASLLDELDVSRTEAAEGEARTRALEQANAELQAACAELRQKQDALIIDHQAEIADLHGQIGQWTEQVGEWEARARALEQANAELQAACTELRQKQDALITDHQAEIADLRGQIGQWTQQVGEREARARGLEKIRVELEQTRADSLRKQRRVDYVEAKVGEVVSTLRDAPDQLRSLAKTKPYRLAHLFRRLERDIVKGNRQQRRRALRWLRRRLVGRQTPREEALNPLLDHAARIREARDALSDLANRSGHSSARDEPPAVAAAASEPDPDERFTSVATAGEIRADSKGFLGRSRMNGYEYLFDTYRRTRDRIFPVNWQRVEVPYEPGLVSIILPSYDGEDLVREALDSILSQTYSNIEIIAINDGSRDNTGAILDAYARQDRRLTIVHQENQHLPRTLSRGFRLARGEFLTWTSVDNRLKPDCIGKLVDALKRHSDWDMAYANLEIIGDDGQPLRGTGWYGGYQRPAGSEYIHLPGDTAELNVYPNNYIGAAFLYRARVAWALGDYSPVRVLMEDYDYWMRVNEVMKLRHADFDDCIYEYRFHDNSLTSKDPELGITRNRVKLMVFDDFRRSFYLSRTLWVVTSDGSAAAHQVSDALKEHVRKAEHVLLGADEVSRLTLPRLWMPIAWVHVGAPPDPSGHPPSLGDLAAKILVTTSGAVDLPPDTDWTTCISTQPAQGDVLPRLGGGYRGWWSVSDASDLFTVCDLHAKNRQLAAIEARAAELATQGPAAQPKLSVIICTYQRPAALENALRALAGQTLDRTAFEVIVVNNEPGAAYPEEIAAAVQAECDGSAAHPIRVLDCPLPGLSHARNAGISEAQGDYLVFLDDDAVANPDCLEWLLHSLETHPNAGVIGGHIRVDVPTPRPSACPEGRESLWGQLRTGRTEYFETADWWEYPWGGNWAARRTALFEMGGFRCNFGRNGGDFGGGEEVVAACLVHQLGYAVGIEPRAEVLHDVELQRFTKEYAVRTLRAGIIVNYQMQQSLYIPRESAAHVWKEVKHALLTRSTDDMYEREAARARLRVLWMMAVDAHRRRQRPVTSC